MFHIYLVVGQQRMSETENEDVIHSLKVEAYSVPRVGEYVEYSESGWYGTVTRITHEWVAVRRTVNVPTGVGETTSARVVGAVQQEIRVYLDGIRLAV